MIAKMVINMCNIYILLCLDRTGSLACVCVYLCRHMHEENSSDGSLSLTVTLVRTIQTISLQDVEEALLPESRKVKNLYL